MAAAWRQSTAPAAVGRLRSDRNYQSTNDHGNNRVSGQGRRVAVATFDRAWRNTIAAAPASLEALVGVGAGDWSDRIGGRLYRPAWPTHGGRDRDRSGRVSVAVDRTAQRHRPGFR